MDLGPFVHEVARKALFSGAILVRKAADEVSAAFGAADLAGAVTNTPGTRFNTASLTKLMTAVAVCRLVDAGRCALGQPVRELLPDAALPSADQMTLAHLLSHRAGFVEAEPDDATPYGPAGWLAYVREPLEFRPGDRFGYSNVGYAVVGAIIERIMGMPYFDAMTELVFEPAGMTRTSFEDTGVRVDGRAIGYLRAPSSPEDIPPDNLSAGLGRGAPFGYATSTVADIAALVEGVASQRVVSPLFSTRILDGDVGTGTPGRYGGLGMFREWAHGVAISTSSGAGPGISAWLDYIPARQYLGVVLSNYAKPAAHDVGLVLRSAVLSHQR